MASIQLRGAVSGRAERWNIAMSSLNTNTVTHPSVFIQDELDARGWSLDRLAIEMGDDAGVNRLALDLYMEVGRTDRNLRIGQFSSKQLGKAFGVSPEFFLNLEKQWLEGKAA